MNERIKTLAIEAGGGPSKWYNDPNVLEKFAELILEEVAIVSANLSNYYSKKLLYAETDAERDLEHRAGAACIHVMVDVKKHFGQDPNDIRRYFDKPAELNK